MSKITVDERGIYLRELMITRELIWELKAHNIEYEAITPQFLRIKGHTLINPERLPFVTIACHVDEQIIRHTSLQLFFGTADGYVVMTDPSLLGIPSQSTHITIIPYNGERSYMHVRTVDQDEFQLTGLFSKGDPVFETVNLSTEGHFVLGLYLFFKSVIHKVHSLTEQEAQDLFSREGSKHDRA